MKTGDHFNPYGLFIGSFMPNVIMRDKNLSSSEKLCYARLAQFAGRDGRCFPSLSTLAEEVGLERRQTINIINGLEEKKFIKVIKRVREDNSLTSNEYEFLWHESFEESAKGSATDCTRASAIRDTPASAMGCTTLRESVVRESVVKDVSNETSVGPNGPTNSTPRLSLRKNKDPVEFGGHLPERIDVVEIFSYWNTSPGLSHHKTPKRNEAPTKSLISIYKAIGGVLDGTFLKDWPPYPSDQIIKAIEGFKTRRTNPDYSPTNKDTLKSIDLTTFFWNPYSSHMPSMFLECLNNPPKLLKNTVPKEVEKNPQLTKWLQKMYIDKVLLKQPKVFNQVEINKFIKGANLLQDSIANLRKRANLMTGPYEFCEYTINALLANFRREDIKPGNISSDWTYNELLPRYLKEVGRID